LPNENSVAVAEERLKSEYLLRKQVKRITDSLNLTDSESVCNSLGLIHSFIPIYISLYRPIGFSRSLWHI